MSAVHPGYAPPSGPDRPSSRPWARRLLIAGTAAWAVLLAGLAWWSARTDEPTVREQRTTEQAAPVVNAAVGQLVAALDGTAWAMTPSRVELGCRVTPVSTGAEVTRGIDVLVVAGGERDLLSRVADELPGRWRAGVGDAAEGPLLRADAGEFVLVEGESTSPGRVRFEVLTGCRPTDAAIGDLLPGKRVSPALQAALQALDRPVPEQVDRIWTPCPGGAKAWTERMEVGPEPASLSALAPLAAAGTVVVDTPEVYAYRSGTDLVIADATGDQLHLMLSNGCAE
ncbi:hypothetical protein [Salinispora cortesiana]|uniref:hypothetical protein n=1 Tax=Salinispora cortesiana TaxID=1305843 RepID=UPI00046FFD13|nr:hypothetical protein [Salinispora cortesiana]